VAAGDRHRWNEKWAQAGAGTAHRSELVELIAPWLPPSGRLLDVAGGGSGASLLFARHGLDVTVCDISDVGLDRTRHQAEDAGLRIQTVLLDLEIDPVPSGPWDVVTIANYLQRDLFPGLIDHLASGGVLGVVIATTTNLERHDKPGESFLVEPGELPTLVDGLEIVHHSETWRANGRHEAHLVAREVAPEQGARMMR
jgi:tellurite methyltransferase